MEGYLRINEPQGQITEIIGTKLRCLVIAAGVISGVAGFFSVGPLILLTASFQILGAIVQPNSPRPGRWLLWVGSLILSLYVGFLVVPGISESMRLVRSYGDISSLTVFSISLISVLLIIWSDTALLIDAWRLRLGPQSADYGLPHAGDWFVWFAAVCMSIWVFPIGVISLLAYRRTGSLSMALLPLMSGLITAFFDAVLMLDAFKNRRPRASGSGGG